MKKMSEAITLPLWSLPIALVAVGLYMWATIWFVSTSVNEMQTNARIKQQAREQFCAQQGMEYYKPYRREAFCANKADFPEELK